MNLTSLHLLTQAKSPLTAKDAYKTNSFVT